MKCGVRSAECGMPTNPNERLMRFLQATPEQQEAIDRILEGRIAPPSSAPPVA